MHTNAKDPCTDLVQPAKMTIERLTLGERSEKLLADGLWERTRCGKSAVRETR